jgi:hypothetical protein
MTIDDLLDSHCNDRQYAAFMLKHLKQIFFDDLTLTYRRIGNIDQADICYGEAISRLNHILHSVNIPLLKNKLIRTWAIIHHNQSHLKNLKGEFKNAFDLMNKALLFRANNRMHMAFCNSMNIIKDLYST